MTDKKEIRIETPEIVHEASASIRESGEFKKGLSGQEIKGMMTGIIRGVMDGNSSVDAEIPFMSVGIDEGRGNVKATIRIEKPIGATVTADIVLANERSGKNALELGDLKVDAKADGFAGKLALKAVDVEGQVRKALSNPTEALTNYLGVELKKDGVQLDGIAMKFTKDDKLTVLLRGKAV